MVLEKLYPKTLNVWKDGQFGIEVENGVYNFGTDYSTLRGFTTSGTKLTATLAQTNIIYTLTSKNEIDFSGRSTVKVIEDTYGELSLDVSGYDGTGYLAVAVKEDAYQTRKIYICVCSNKTNFDSHVISSLVVQGTNNQVNQSISRITIE